MKEIKVDDRAYELIKAHHARICERTGDKGYTLRRCASELVEAGFAQENADVLATSFAGKLRAAMEAVAAADRADRAQEAGVALSCLEAQALALRATCVAGLLAQGKSPRALKSLMNEAYEIVLAEE